MQSPPPASALAIFMGVIMTAAIWNRKHATACIVAIIFVLAFLERFAAIFWGVGILPDETRLLHPDEVKIVGYVTKFPNSFWTQTDFRYPLGLHHVLAFVHQYLVVVFNVVPKADIARWFPDPLGKIEMAWFYSRLVVVAMGVASVFITWTLARKNDPTPAGILWPLALMCIFPYPVLNSAFVTTDVPLAFLLLASYAWFCHCRTTDALGSMRYGILQGLLIGITVSVKYTGVFMLGPLFLFSLYECYRGRIPVLNTLGVWLFALGAASIAFALLMPQVVLNPSQIAQGLNQEINRTSAYTLSPMRFVTSHALSLGIPGLLLVVAGLPLAWRRNRALTIELSIILLAFYALCGKAIAPRYVIAIAPFLAILAGYGLAALTSLQWRKARLAAVLVGAVAVIQIPVCLYARYELDSRIEVTRYLREHYPEGTSVACNTFGNYNDPNGWQFPKFPREQFTVIDGLDDPDILVLPSRFLGQMIRALETPNSITMPQVWPKNTIPSPETLDFFKDLLTRKSPYRWVTAITPPKLPLEFSGDRFDLYERVRP